jgi:hypothetical protein
MSNQFDIASISSSAMLVDLSIKSWSGTKVDKDATQMVDVVKLTTGNAGRYQKNMFAGTKDLHEINKLDSRIRAWNINATLPWSDKGQRLLPSSRFFEYKKALSTYEDMRTRMVEGFLEKYDDLILQAQRNLGELFVREDYPSIETVASQFQFKYSFLPVPVAGDFRVDVGNDAIAELQAQFATSVDSRIGEAMTDVYDRLQECLTRMSERLTDVVGDDTSKRKIFRDTLVSNAQELAADLKHLNIVGDPKVEDARKRLARVVDGLSAETLRDSPATRMEVKQEVDDILSKFNF